MELYTETPTNLLTFRFAYPSIHPTSHPSIQSFTMYTHRYATHNQNTLDIKKAVAAAAASSAIADAVLDEREYKKILLLFP